MNVDSLRELSDPIKFGKVFWPDVQFYREQREIIYSVHYNDETYVRAGNMLGKDYVAGFIALHAFLTNPIARIVTTSVKDDHLRVLWGELNRYIDTCRYPLRANKGGPLNVYHREIRKVSRGKDEQGKATPKPIVDKISYLIGMVSEKGEGMAGHHAPYTLGIVDEASGVADMVYTQMATWARRIFVFGNPNPCNNFFFQAFKGNPQTGDPGGDIKSEEVTPTPSQQPPATAPYIANEGGQPVSGSVQGQYRPRYHRKCLRIRGEDSPNVVLALEEKARGRQPSNQRVLAGVLHYRDGIHGYEYRRKYWDKVRQCIGLDAEFYLGAEILLFPPDWLNHAEQVAEGLRGRNRIARGIGVDPAEGGDKTALAAVDERGLIEIISLPTPNTRVIPGVVKAFAIKHQCRPSCIVFDSGGGGKQHADSMREEQGWGDIRTVAFGETIVLLPKRSKRQFPERVEIREEKYTYVNRRAQMYGELSLLLDPNREPGMDGLNYGTGFAIPANAFELRRQLAPIPKTYDPEGRLRLLPKNKRSPDSQEKTLVELIGCSPDEADALALAVHAMLHKGGRVVAGASMM